MLRKSPSRRILIALSSFMLAASTAIFGACVDGEAPDAGSGTRAGSTPAVLHLDPYFRELKTLDVEVGGETLPFLFDTGGGVSLISIAVAESIGCSPHGRTAGFRMSGEPVDFQLCNDVTLQLGDLEIPHSTIAVWDIMAVLPEGFPPLGGLISLKTFEDLAITLDLSTGELIVETAASLPERTSGMNELEARVATGGDGAALTLFLAARAQIGKLWLLLDSGNIDRTLLAPHAAFEQLGLSRSEDAAGADNSGGRWELPAVSLQLLGLEPRETPVGVQSLIYDGAIGAAFMQNWVFTMDLPEGRVWASPGSR